MKTFIYLILSIWIPAFAGMTILTGCGNDTVTNSTNNNAGQVLFSSDSLSIFIDSTYTKNDSLFFNYQNSITVSFNLKTNVLDTTLSSTTDVLFWIITDSTHNFGAIEINHPLDTNYSLNIINNQPWQIQFIKFMISLHVPNIPSPYYVIIRNFKITSLN